MGEITCSVRLDKEMGNLTKELFQEETRRVLRLLRHFLRPKRQPRVSSVLLVGSSYHSSSRDSVAKI